MKSNIKLCMSLIPFIIVIVFTAYLMSNNSIFGSIFGSIFNRDKFVDVADKAPLTDMEFRTLINPRKNPIKVKQMTTSGPNFFKRYERLTDYSDIIDL